MDIANGEEHRPLMCDGGKYMADVKGNGGTIRSGVLSKPVEYHAQPDSKPDKKRHLKAK